MCQASPPPVHNLHLGPAVTEELVVCPGCEEDGVDPEEDHKHDHSHVLGTGHRLDDPPHVQGRPHRHGVRHAGHVDILLPDHQPHHD